MASTKIEWATVVWNPVVGCTKVSRGCKNCYAEVQARRFMGIRNFSAGDRSIQHVTLRPDRLEAPLHWRKPRRVFGNSMSDLFHKDVPLWFLHQVFGVMAKTPQHTYMILTKRPERMQELLRDPAFENRIYQLSLASTPWPLPNVWPGVSVEDPPTARARIPLLLQTPAARRFVNYEPALEKVDFTPWLPCHCGAPDQMARREEWRNQIDWLIIGGESGPRARPFDIAWASSSIAQCRAAGVPAFVKQLGSYPICDWDTLRSFPLWENLPVKYSAKYDRVRVLLNDRKSGDPAEWPKDLRVREWLNET